MNHIDTGLGRHRRQINAEAPMEIAELALRIERFPAHLPISDKCEKASRALSSKEHHHVWYSSQKKHWLGWLSQYPWGKSAEFVYNHLKCAPMLAWLAEATGVSKVELTSASDAPWQLV